MEPGTAQTSVSKQIDVLIYDTSYPLLHQDADPVFVTPDAVRGIIEVKATLRRGEMVGILERLAHNASLLPRGAESAFVGLFGYEAELGADPESFLLTKLKDGAGGKRAAAVNHVSAGKSLFVRFWTDDPFDSQVAMNVWRTYPMNDMSRGYFIFNAIEVAVGKQQPDFQVHCPHRAARSRKMAHKCRKPNSRKLHRSQFSTLAAPTFVAGVLHGNGTQLLRCRCIVQFLKEIVDHIVLRGFVRHNQQAQ